MEESEGEREKEQEKADEMRWIHRRIGERQGFFTVWHGRRHFYLSTFQVEPLELFLDTCA